jgi:diacylglycerol kinase (ATP)
MGEWNNASTNGLGIYCGDCDSVDMLSFIKSVLRRNTNATLWSVQGFMSAMRSEEGMRQWSIVAFLATVLAFVLNLNGLERAMVIAFSWNIVLMELANTAIEVVVDRISDEVHPLSKKAKDIGSAMVFFAIILALLVWILVLIG